VKNLARYLISKGSTELNNFELKDFWQKCLERLSDDLVLSGKKVQKPQAQAPEELSIEQKKRLREGEKEAAVKEVKETKPPETVFEKATEKPADKVTEIVPDIVIERPSVKPNHLDTGSVLNVLEKLAKGITSVSNELAAIRRLMEDDKKRAAGR